MGFSSPEGGDTGSKDTSNVKQGPSFGDRLLSYLGSKYPIAGGLANLAFGGHEQQPQQAPEMNAPPVPMVAQAPDLPPQPDLISMNAQPKQSGGGLQTILKLLAG